MWTLTYMQTHFSMVEQKVHYQSASGLNTVFKCRSEGFPVLVRLHLQVVAQAGREGCSAMSQRLFIYCKYLHRERLGRYLQNKMWYAHMNSSLAGIILSDYVSKESIAWIFIYRNFRSEHLSRPENQVTRKNHADVQNSTHYRTSKGKIKFRIFS